MSNPIEDLKKQTEQMEKENVGQYNATADTGSVHYELMNKLYSTLDVRKGFEVAMNGPREGKIFLTYQGIEFTVDVKPTLVESENSKLFK